MKTKLAYALSIALMTSIGLAPAGDTLAGERTAGEVVDERIIAAQTRGELAADPVPDAIKIDVEGDKSDVQLNGFVDSMEARPRAEEIVRGIKGVESVDNSL